MGFEAENVVRKDLTPIIHDPDYSAINFTLTPIIGLTPSLFPSLFDSDPFESVL